jgi:hypothetical protein
MQAKPFRTLSAVTAGGLLAAGVGTALSLGSRDLARMEVTPVFVESPLWYTTPTAKTSHKGLPGQNRLLISSPHTAQLTAEKLRGARTSARHNRVAGERRGAH